MTSNIAKSLISGTLFLSLAACLSTEQTPEQAALRAKAQKVRFVPESQVKSCKFVSQQQATTAVLSLGQQYAEASSTSKLMFAAASLDANTIVVADRNFEKSRGGYDKTRVTIYGDLYRC